MYKFQTPPNLDLLLPSKIVTDDRPDAQLGSKYDEGNNNNKIIIAARAVIIIRCMEATII